MAGLNLRRLLNLVRLRLRPPSLWARQMVCGILSASSRTEPRPPEIPTAAHARVEAAALSASNQRGTRLRPESNECRTRQMTGPERPNAAGFTSGTWLRVRTGPCGVCGSSPNGGTPSTSPGSASRAPPRARKSSLIIPGGPLVIERVGGDAISVLRTVCGCDPNPRPAAG
jgi:hypothetical protein